MSDEANDDIRKIVADAAEAMGGRVMSDGEFAEVMAEGDRLAEERRAADAAAGKRFLDEERDREIIDAWYADARAMTLDRLPEFVNNLANGYRHDYGTICHALSAAALAAAYALENSPAGGITGFQSGFVMWGFVKRWMHLDGPARIVNYQDLLFPQYERTFRGISAETWSWAQEEARKKLAETDSAADTVRAHWQAIADGIVPFGLAITDD